MQQNFSTLRLPSLKTAPLIFQMVQRYSFPQLSLLLSLSLLRGSFHLRLLFRSGLSPSSFFSAFSSFICPFVVCNTLAISVLPICFSFSFQPQLYLLFIYLFGERNNLCPVVFKLEKRKEERKDKQLSILLVGKRYLGRKWRVCWKKRGWKEKVHQPNLPLRKSCWHHR